MMMSRPAVRTFALLLLGFNAAAGSGGSQDTTATQTPTQIIDLDFVLSRAPGFPPFDCTRARRSE